MQNTAQSTLFELLDVPEYPCSPAVRDAVERLSSDSTREARGAVYTRSEVVDFVLDLVGYTPERPLCRQRILEPSFGRGDFLLPVVDRVLLSWTREDHHGQDPAEEMGQAIRAVELHRETFRMTREAVIQRLLKASVPEVSALNLANQWLIQGDFLLESLKPGFDYVVGNPPYVRQEMIPSPLIKEYRRRYRTVFDRADLYIPFIERSLSLLGENATLGFICADRWMKNRYGQLLREFISNSFHLKAYIDMMGTDSFHSEVSAYPAITIITTDRTPATRIAHRPRIERSVLKAIASDVHSAELRPDSCVTEVTGVVNGSEPWIMQSRDQVQLIRRLEDTYPPLEHAGCRVGIGVATGADKAFIGDFEELDVEDSRKLPLVATRDIRSGRVDWQGQGVINPYNEDGGLVNLTLFPRLSRYLEERREQIAHRHCARKNPSQWYRTIDRIYPELAAQPKLLIPDIKGEAHIVLEAGRLYPHHNLYYVVSDTWDLEALQAVLMSSITRFFIATYSTRMRGGYLRFQAQYLRRIRIPFWRQVSDDLRADLIRAARTRDLEACNRAVFALYRIGPGDRSALRGNGVQDAA